MHGLRRQRSPETTAALVSPLRRARSRERSRPARPRQRRPPRRASARRACSGVRETASSPPCQDAPAAARAAAAPAGSDSPPAPPSPGLRSRIVPSTAPTRLTAALCRVAGCREEARTRASLSLPSPLSSSERHEASQDLREDDPGIALPPSRAERRRKISSQHLVERGRVRVSDRLDQCGALSERGWCQCRRPAPDRR